MNEYLGYPRTDDSVRQILHSCNLKVIPSHAMVDHNWFAWSQPLSHIMDSKDPTLFLLHKVFALQSRYQRTDLDSSLVVRNYSGICMRGEVRTLGAIT